MTTNGRFGSYGGRYAPETLVAALDQLEAAWNLSRSDRAFNEELQHLSATFAGRPTPLYFAARLSRDLGLNLWLKREDLLHTGAHKINNALGQCLLAKRMKKTRIVAETGAGQHGVATAAACAHLGLECVVYMGEVDAERQRPNVLRMELLGARVERVHSGQRTLKDAVNAALRDWAGDPITTHYCIGSVLGPHPFPSMVAAFHAVIGREALAQWRASPLHGDTSIPDVVVACVGGGSNAIGIFQGFIDDSRVALVGVEAGGRGIASGEHAARFAGGSPGVLHGTFTYLLQDDEGQIRPTHSVSAGLDYPAVGPMHAQLFETERVRYTNVGDDEALLAFELLARREGILPALESAHALAWVVRESRELRGKSVLLNLSGRGDKDLDTVARIRRAKESS